MRNTLYNHDNIGAIQKLIDDRIQSMTTEGTIVSVNGSGTEAQVMINGSGTVTTAAVAKGLKPAQNDRVILTRAPRTARWIVYMSYSDSRIAGNAASGSGSGSSGSGTGGGTALAPSDLTAISGFGFFIVRWTVGVDTTGIFEVEVADDTAETNAVTLIVAGGVLPYSASIVKHVRVRAIDADWNRSGWTTWVTATPGARVGLSQGGTNADLSATGPGFLKQATTGANVSVGPIAQADLPVFTGDSGSGGVKGAVPAPAPGDSAAAKFLSAAGTWQVLSFNAILTDEDGLILVDLDGNVLTE